jgi:peptide/nickel transport system substrate-binding protein
MIKLTQSRRDLLRNAAALSAITALGLKPEMVLGAEGGILKSRMEADIKVLDPGYMNGGTESSIVFACLPKLAEPIMDANGVWGWKPSDFVEKIDWADDTHIPFTLKQGMMWNGDIGELTSEDVKYSFERMLKSDWASRWPTLDHVDIVDKYNGVIVLKSPFSNTFLMGVASESGGIVPKSATEKLQDQRFTTELPGQLGPYTMTEWLPKQRIVLKRNAGFKGTQPYFDEVQFISIEDTSSAALAYEAGEIMITNLTPETAVRYKSKPPANTAIVDRAGPYYTWMGMNTEHPKLKDIRVRKAIQRAIDPDAILAGAYGGAAPRAYGVVPIGVLGQRKESKYSYNPEEAKALLAEAGVSDLSLELRVLNEALYVAGAQIIQANLGDVGIKVEIIPVDSGPFWDMGLEEKGDMWKSLELWTMRYRTSPDPADAIQWFIKSQVGVWNWERWSDPEFEELWAKGLGEPNAEKRAAMYVRMQEIMEDTGAYFWITHDPLFYAYNTSITPDFDPGGEVMVERVKGA